MKRIAGVMLCLFAVIACDARVLGSSPTISDTIQKYIDSEAVSQVTSVDVSNGRIEGANADYAFVLPRAWQDNITAERENTSDARVLEKLNFYCLSYSERYRSKLLMSFYVFDSAKWSDPAGYEPIVRTKDYVFAYQLGDREGFTLEVDQAVYSDCWKAVSTATLLLDYIEIPDSQKLEPEYACFVYGEQVYGAIEVVDKVYYLPLRDVCEAMGYTVGWNDRARKITVTKSGFSDEFKLYPGKGTDGRGIKMIAINDRTYVSTAYFLKVLGCDIDIDENKNVYIS